MTEAKHTPGPWSIYEHVIGEVVSSDGGLVAAASCPSTGKHEETLANARMIAAAPDLYEALANLSPRFERCCIASGSDPEYAREATAKSRSALSKARGDTR